jgi:AAA+ ATPase superfamily predicted ATPase
LRAIAAGNRRPADIARAIGKNSAQDVARQLDTLRGLGLVRREVPVTEVNAPRSRRSLYWLADNFLAFWYRYVDPLRGLIAQGRPQRAWAQIQSTFHAYVAFPPWEDVCRQFLWRLQATQRLPSFDFSTLGRWWNGSHEIDIVGLDDRRRCVLFGSCKWTNARVGIRDLYHLEHTVDSVQAEFPKLPVTWKVLFSREGFEPELQALVDQPDSGILLFTPEDLFEN